MVSLSKYHTHTVEWSRVSATAILFLLFFSLVFGCTLHWLNAAMLTNLTLKFNNVQLAHYYCNAARCSCVCTLYWRARASAPIVLDALTHSHRIRYLGTETNRIVYAPCTPVMQINNSVRWSMVDGLAII